MPRKSNREAIAAILARYPDTTPITAIARAEGLKPKSFSSQVYRLRLRTPYRTRPPRDTHLIPLLLGKFNKVVGAGIVTDVTIGNWRAGRTSPTLAIFLKVVEANGLRVELIKTENDHDD